MNTLTKLALGLMGQIKARPAVGRAAATLALPLATRQGGVPLMEYVFTGVHGILGFTNQRLTFARQAAGAESETFWVGLRRLDTSSREFGASQAVDLYGFATHNTPREHVR